MVPPHPLVAENMGVFSLNIFYSYFYLREWLTMASAMVIRLLEGIRFISQKGDAI